MIKEMLTEERSHPKAVLKIQDLQAAADGPERGTIQPSDPVARQLQGSQGRRGLEGRVGNVLQVTGGEVGVLQAIVTEAEQIVGQAATLDGSAESDAPDGRKVHPETRLSEREDGHRSV